MRSRGSFSAASAIVNGTHSRGALLIGMIQSLGAGLHFERLFRTSIAFGLLVLTLIFFPRGSGARKGRRECLGLSC